MVELETVYELAEDLADLLGVYGNGPGDNDHLNDCECRICFVDITEDRIRVAVGNETLL